MTRQHPRPPIRQKIKVALLLAAALALGALDCGTFTGVPASLVTVADSGMVYAINGAPQGAPTALHVFSGQLLAADASFIFDVAFDIDPQGAISILPQRVVASGLTPTHTVGLQAVTGTYDELTSAPKTGYRADTALVVTLGRVVVIQSADANACGVSLTGTTLYGKLVILAVDRAARTLNLRYTVDPNCGFVSFASGLPKN